VVVVEDDDRRADAVHNYIVGENAHRHLMAVLSGCLGLNGLWRLSNGHALRSLAFVAFAITNPIGVRLQNRADVAQRRQRFWCGWRAFHKHDEAKTFLLTYCLSTSEI